MILPLHPNPSLAHPSLAPPPSLALRPGGILFEFAGDAEAAAQLRELLRQPEELVQHPGHMQQLIGMVDTARKLLTAQPGDAAPAAPAAPGLHASAGLPHEAAAAAAGGHLPGSAFHLAAAQPAAAPKHRGGRKRKGAWAEGVPLECLGATGWAGCGLFWEAGRLGCRP